MTAFTEHKYGSTSPQCQICSSGDTKMYRDHTVQMQVCSACFVFLSVAHLVLGRVPGLRHPTSKDGPMGNL